MTILLLSHFQFDYSDLIIQRNQSEVFPSILSSVKMKVILKSTNYTEVIFGLENTSFIVYMFNILKKIQFL